jgi:HEAT repeat protein
MWPFDPPERTTLITPAMRVSAIQESVARARSSGVGQLDLCRQLATQIRTEPDPIVRRTIQEAMGEFDTQLAQAVLEAGLNDDNLDVQVTCCRILGERGKRSAIQGLSRVINTATDDEARLAAVDALGQIDAPESIAAIALALKDNDPALQYAGVQAMQNISTEDLGNDVHAWREYARTQAPDDSETAVAKQPGGTSSR